VAHSTPRRRLLALLAIAVVPWTAVFIGGEVTLLFPFGVFNSNPPQVTDLYTLLSFGWRLPRNPHFLPLSYSFYAIALVSVAAGVANETYEPTRLTAGLPVPEGFTHRHHAERRVQALLDARAVRGRPAVRSCLVVLLGRPADAGGVATARTGVTGSAPT
jgi:uncharacterized protein (TIGR04206 family)